MGGRVVGTTVVVVVVVVVVVNRNGTLKGNTGGIGVPGMIIGDSVIVVNDGIAGSPVRAGVVVGGYGIHGVHVSAGVVVAGGSIGGGGVVGGGVVVVVMGGNMGGTVVVVVVPIVYPVILNSIPTAELCQAESPVVYSNCNVYIFGTPVLLVVDIIPASKCSSLSQLVNPDEIEDRDEIITPSNITVDASYPLSTISAVLSTLQLRDSVSPAGTVISVVALAACVFELLPPQSEDGSTLKTKLVSLISVHVDAVPLYILVQTRGGKAIIQ